MRELLTRQEASEGLARVAAEIVQRIGEVDQLALVGIRRVGPAISKHLAGLIREQTGVEVPIGEVDITLYRDDTAKAFANPQIGESDVPFDVRTKTIVLVDDVLFTGRTVRAAMHALLDYGRARAIWLAVLVDRGGRELPIQPDFTVKCCPVEKGQRVEVLEEPDGFRAVVQSGQ